MSELLRSYLALHRKEINHRVDLVRRSRTAFEGQSFARILKDGLAPLIEALALLRPGLTEKTASEGIDLALEITVLSPERNGFLEEILSLWSSLSRHAQSLGDNPGQILAKLSNALLFFRQHETMRTSDWLEHLRRMEQDASSLEDRALFLAWISGFAPLREHVLSLPEQFGHAFLSKALGLADPYPAFARLGDNPWWDTSEQKARVTFRVGRFEGYGGLFAVPPTAFVHRSHVLVNSGPKTFRLHADRFGVQLIALPGQITPPEEPSSNKEAKDLVWNESHLCTPSGDVQIPFLQANRRVVAADGMIVVTSPYSFSLLVIAP